jgi:hemoglobin-like flavoprotein
VGLDDRDGLRMLRDAVDPRLEGEELIRQFYTKWFAIDLAVRDLFPPDLGGQFTVFSQALTWLFGELIDQRAEEPVAFLAQLGRDHRKYGVVQSHYFSMHEALYSTTPHVRPSSCSSVSCAAPQTQSRGRRSATEPS